MKNTFINLDEFQIFLQYCKALGFEDKPDYSYLRKMFKELFISEKFNKDFKFDWIPANVIVNNAI
jgi:hypothetical protein